MQASQLISEFLGALDTLDKGLSQLMQVLTLVVRVLTGFDLDLDFAGLLLLRLRVVIVALVDAMRAVVLCKLQKDDKNEKRGEKFLVASRVSEEKQFQFQFQFQVLL